MTCLFFVCFCVLVSSWRFILYFQGAGTFIESVLQAVTTVKLSQDENSPWLLTFTKNNAWPMTVLLTLTVIQFLQSIAAYVLTQKLNCKTPCTTQLSIIGALAFDMKDLFVLWLTGFLCSTVDFHFDHNRSLEYTIYWSATPLYFLTILWPAFTQPL